MAPLHSGWLELLGEYGHTKLEAIKLAINCYACTLCSANGHEKFRGRGTKTLPTPHPLPTCAHAHQDTSHLPKSILGASVGEGSVGKVREKGVCTLTLHTHTLLALPLAQRALQASAKHVGVRSKV